MKKQIVVLQITYDEQEYPPPETWLWPDLLDLPDPEHVSVLAASSSAPDFVDEHIKIIPVTGI